MSFPPYGRLRLASWINTSAIVDVIEDSPNIGMSHKAKGKNVGTRFSLCSGSAGTMTQHRLWDNWDIFQHCCYCSLNILPRQHLCTAPVAGSQWKLKLQWDSLYMHPIGIPLLISTTCHAAESTGRPDMSVTNRKWCRRWKIKVWRNKSESDGWHFVRKWFGASSSSFDLNKKYEVAVLCFSAVAPFLVWAGGLSVWSFHIVSNSKWDLSEHSSFLPRS